LSPRSVAGDGSTGGPVAVMRWLAAVAAVFFAGVSAYGWWFYFAAGPVHGPGLEIALGGAVLAAIALFLATSAGRLPPD
jgi:hypothetical protein